MKRLLSLILAVSFIVLLFAGCSRVPNLPSYEEAATMETEETTSAIKETGEISIGLTKTSISMGSVYFLDTIDNDKAIGKYKYEFIDNASTMGDKLVSGELTIGFMDVQNAVNLCNKHPDDVKIVALSSLNNTHFVEMTKAALSTDELKANGGKLYIGSSNSYTASIVKFIFEKKGISSSVSLNYQYDEKTLASLVKSNRVMHCLLSEPYVSSALAATEKEVIGMDLGKLWSDACMGTDYEGSNICTGVIVVNANYLKDNSELVEGFLREYSSSAKNVNSQKTAGDLLKQYGFIDDVEIADTVISRSNITCIKNTDMKENLSKFLSAIGVTFDAEKSIYVD